MCNTEWIEGLTNTLHNIGAVFVQLVVHAVGAVGARALVVYCESAAEIEITHRCAFLNKASVKTTGI